MADAYFEPPITDKEIQDALEIVKNKLEEDLDKLRTKKKRNFNEVIFAWTSVSTLIHRIKEREHLFKS